MDPPGEPPISGKVAGKDLTNDLKLASKAALDEGYNILLLDIHTHPPDDITGNGIDETDYDNGNVPSGEDLITIAS